MADAVLELIPSLVAYQREIMKIPGMTDKAAAAAAIKFAQQSRKGAEKAADEYADAAREAAEASRKAAEESGAAWTSAWQTATVAVGSLVAAAVGLYGIAKTVAEWHDEIDDLAISTGVAADTVQALQLHAAAMGGSFEDAAGVVKKLPKLMGDADRRVKAAALGFETLGVDIHDASGEMRSTDDVLRDVIRGLGNIDDASEKARASMLLFGRQGASALEAFGAGAALFEQHEKIAKRYGIETGPEASEAAARLQEEMARLGLVAKGAGDDLWSAFGGQDGALGGVRMMTAGVIGATETILGLAETVKIGWREVGLVMTGVGGAWVGGEMIVKARHAMERGKAAAQEYLDTADQTDRIAGAASAAVAALGEEIEGTGRKTKEATDPAKVYADQLAEIAGIQRDLTEDLLTDSQRITDAWIRQTEPLVALVELYGAEGEIAQAAMDALADAEGRLQRDLLALEAARLDEEEKLRQRDYEAREAERQADFRRVEGYASAELQAKWALADQVVGLASFVGGQLAQSERKQWAWQQAGALAQAGINLWQGISEASASAPPPWNAIPIALAAAQGAMAIGQIAAVPAPAAYGGLDFAYAQSTGTPVIVHPGEDEKNGRIRTRSEVESERRPRQVIVSTTIGSREVARSVADDTRAGGPLAAEQARRFGRVGHSQGWR